MISLHAFFGFTMSFLSPRYHYVNKLGVLALKQALFFIPHKLAPLAFCTLRLKSNYTIITGLAGLSVHGCLNSGNGRDDQVRSLFMLGYTTTLYYGSGIQV